MTAPPPPHPPARLILRIWIGIVATVAAIVLFFGFLGGPILDWIARHDPSLQRRRELDSLQAAKQALAGQPQPPDPPALGISLAQCLLQATVAEKRGDVAAAHLWLALDAHGRSNPELAFSHERDALAAAGHDPAQPTEARLDAILPGYAAMKKSIAAKIPAPSKPKR